MLIVTSQKGVQVCTIKCLFDPINTKELKILGEIPLAFD